MGKQRDTLQMALDEWEMETHVKPIKDWSPLPEGVSHIVYPNGIMITMPERITKLFEELGWRNCNETD